MLAILVITYSFSIIDWNLSEVKRLDIKVRKMMTTHSTHHPKANIHHLYLPRSNRGRGLTKLEQSYNIDYQSFLILKFIRWLDATISFKAWKRKRLTLFCKKEAREFEWEIDLDLETEFDGEMKNRKNAQKLKRIAKGKGKKVIDTPWKSKPLHGQYPLQS